MTIIEARRGSWGSEPGVFQNNDKAWVSWQIRWRCRAEIAFGLKLCWFTAGRWMIEVSKNDLGDRRLLTLADGSRPRNRVQVVERNSLKLDANSKPGA